MSLINKIRLILSLKPELVNFVGELNARYDDTNEWCKKKEWKVFDNIHKTLNVVEEHKGNQLSNDLEDKVNRDWYQDRAVDIALKTFIVVNK